LGESTWKLIATPAAFIGSTEVHYRFEVAREFLA
jgi:hypothetical protein